MKIGIVSPNYLPNVGGTEVALFNIVHNLAHLGHKVVLVSRLFGKEKTNELSNMVQVHRFRTFRNKFSYVHTFLFLYNFLKTYLKDADIIHQFHIFRFGIPTYLFCKKFNKPLITSLMGADTYDEERKVPKIFFPYFAFIMNKSNFITSPSRIIASYAYKQGCKKEIQIIPHGTDIAKFENINEQSVINFKKNFAIENNTRILLAVQRLSPRKRVEVLIHCAKELRDYYKVYNFLLLIAGKGEQKEKLARLVQKLRLENHVKFLGFVPAELLPICYKAADIFVFHSTFEAFGLVLTEAMAAGKPVVTTRVGAIPEVIKEGETGLLANKDDPRGLAGAINKLLKDSELLKQMGEKGKIRAKSLYDWNDICKRYLNLYRIALDNK